MTKITVYGIKNCDTMKKAFVWLDARKIAYIFHDYKKSGADKKVLETAIRQLGWENAINHKGTTWRALPDKVKDSMTAGSALKCAMENPSMIRRPLVVRGGKIILSGFDADEYAKVLG